MDESILTSIKKLLGISEEDENFDTDIILHINTYLSRLIRMGVGPSTGFSIADKSKVWSEFIPENRIFEDIKSYVYLKVKLIFDPPLSSSVLESMKETVKELELGIYIEADGGDEQIV